MSSRTKYILFKIIELVSLFTPIIVLVCLRFDVWFVKKEQVDVINVSFGAILCGIVCFFLLKGYAKKVSGIVWCGVLFLTTYLLKSIIADAYMILGMTLLGLVISYPFKLLYGRYRDIAKLVKEEYIKTYARDKAEKEINKVA